MYVKHLSFLMAMFAVTVADAADVPNKVVPVAPVVPVTWSWSGFYADVAFGGAVNATNESVSSNTFNGKFSGTPKGLLIGFGLGYEWQLNSTMVWGLFAEGAVADITGAGGLSAPQFVTVQNSTNYLLGAGSRLGYLIAPDLMIYTKFGFAGGGAHPTFSTAISQTVSATSTGWLGGLGMEKRITPNWSVKVEYEHYQLGDQVLTIPIPGNVMTNTAHYDIEVGKVALAYRF